MLSSCYFKTLLFIVGPAWWEFMAAQVATFPSVPSSDSTSSHPLWRLLADPKPSNPGSLRTPVSQYPMALCTTGQKYILLDLTQDLALFNIFQLLTPDPNWFVWWFLQQTFSDELPYTKHGAKCQGTDKDEDVAFIFKEPRVLSSLGFEVRSRGCSRSLLRHFGVFPGVVRNQTTYSDFKTMPFD